MRDACVSKAEHAFTAAVQTMNRVFMDVPRILPLKGDTTWLQSQVWELAYMRAVKPHLHLLRAYKPGTDAVYGELMPILIADIARVTGIDEHSVVLDLGCGIGNILIQLALLTGAFCWGIEYQNGVALLSRMLEVEAVHLMRLLGLPILGKVEVCVGDMFKSVEVKEKLSAATVVIVNNKVFLEISE